MSSSDYESSSGTSSSARSPEESSASTASSPAESPAASSSSETPPKKEKKSSKSKKDSSKKAETPKSDAADTPKGKKKDTPKDSADKERIKGAKKAYKNQDAEASRKAHDESKQKKALLEAAEEKHKLAVGGFLKSIVFGGMDGIITTFAVVASIMGANLAVETVLIMGFANLVADGISMGMGDFLSGKAELDFVKKEREREMWEATNYLDGEREEMIELYEKKGMAKKDAEALIKIFTKKKKYLDIFVDTMMVEELGLMPPDEDDSPAKDGAVTFCSFMVFGLVPLIAYIIFIAVDDGESSSGAETSTPIGVFAFACVLTGITMFILGVISSRFSAVPWWRGGLFTLGNGAIAAGAAYLVGFLLGEAFDIEECA